MTAGIRSAQRAGCDPTGHTALATAWNREPLPGFDYGDSAVTAGEGGWVSIRFSGGLENLAGQKLSLILRMKNAKVWAVRGDIALAGHRLWEGAE